MTSIDELRDAISKGNIQPSNNNPLSKGQIKGPSGVMETYNVFHGWDMLRANLCNKLWGDFNLDLIGFIKGQGYDEGQLHKVLDSVQLDDFHWDWLAKTCIHKSNEYNWFFLDIDSKPQAACLIYHPKASAVDSGDIFYIEYVAVAPWNRTNPMSTKLYSGVGAVIIKQVIDFSTKTLGLRYGFSLHSLPKAKDFYKHIGMDEYNAHDKDDLSYYEMSEAVTKLYMAAS